MSVSVETNDASHVALGTLNETFPTQFTYDDNADVQVFHDGVLQTESVSYTLQGGLGAAGTVTWIGTPTAGKTVLIVRRRPATQTNLFLANDPLPAVNIEKMGDRLARAIAGCLRLALSAANLWDCLSRRLTKVATPVASDDAATKGYVDSKATIAQVPTPADPGDDNKYLRANAGATTWQVPREVPSPGAPDVGQFLKATGVGTFSFEDLTTPSAVAPENWLINGDFQVCRRHSKGGTFTASTTFRNDDATYLLDRWLLLSNGNNVVTVMHDDNVLPSGAVAKCRLTVVTANLKFGIFQPIESARTKQLLKDGISTRVSVQFKARTLTGNPISNIRVGIISWTGAVDSASLLDPVSVWEAAGTNPTLVAGFAYENVPVNIPVNLDTFSTHLVENILIDTALVNNVGVFIWVDDTNAAVSDRLEIADVALVVNTVAGSFLRRSYAEEQMLCHRYFWSSFRELTQPADFAGTHLTANLLMSHGSGAGDVLLTVFYPTAMFHGDNAVYAFYAPTGGSAGQGRNITDSTNLVVTAQTKTQNQATVGGFGAAGSANDIVAYGMTVNSEVGVA